MNLSQTKVRWLAAFLAATVVSQAFAAPKDGIVRSRASKDALEEIAQVRMLSRAVPLCNWGSQQEAMSIANHFAPILIGRSTESFEACQEFVKANAKLAVDAIMGTAPAIDKSLCKEAQHKNNWLAAKQAYTYDKAEASAGTAIYSEDICAYQPLKASRLTPQEAQTYLLQGAEKCNAQVIEKAIDLGADPNRPGKGLPGEALHLEDKFALERAIYRGDSGGKSECFRSIKVLLSKGAKAGQTFRDRGALHLAVQAPAEWIETLMNAGASTNAVVTGEAPQITLADYGRAGRIDVGQTPLMLFVKYRSYSFEHPSTQNTPEADDGMRVLKLYLKNSDLNARDWLGRSALMLAVENKKNKTARALLSAGADKSIKDQFGRNALAYAKLANNQEMESLLSK